MPGKLLDLNKIKPDLVFIDSNIADYKIPKKLKDILQEKLNDEYSFNDYSFSKKIKSNDNTALLPSQYIYISPLLKEYAEALYEYIKIYDTTRNDIAKKLTKDNRNSIDVQNAIKTDSALSSKFSNKDDIINFSNLLAENKKEFGFTAKSAFNADNGKVKPRGTEDFFTSEILSVINTPNNNAQSLGNFIYDICKIENLYDLISNNYLDEKSTADSLHVGVNMLYYGAPGTGKSFKVNNIAIGHVERTVFHPDTQNSDFIGTLKPITEGEKLSYRFSPGPFARALAQATNNPKQPVFLIIEELNRAPAAAVFGELFLLLDRNSDGSGTYDINFPSEEFKAWYNEAIKKNGIEKLRLPSNLSILATMNSADQGVFPLDTAFRRRWLSTYTPVKASEAPNGKITVCIEEKQYSYEWKIFLEYLNNYLIEKLQIEEDRLIGQRFMTKHELQDGSISGKLLIYLWDDLLRHGQREILFYSAHKTYGSLHRANENSEQIFSTDFLDGLDPLPQITVTEPHIENEIETSNS